MSDRWITAAAELSTDDFRCALPFQVWLGETMEVAAFARGHWTASQDAEGAGVPGLESAQRRRGGQLLKGRDAAPVLTALTAAEIVELHGAVTEAQAAYQQAAHPTPASATDLGRARELLSELAHHLEYLFDDGVEDQNDAALASVKQQHQDDPASIDALASELSDYAALAEQHRADLDGLGGFDARHIDEAVELVGRLRRRPRAPVPAATPEAHAALALRNRLATLLDQRERLVRSAAQLVYRNRPALVRQVTSAYERRRKAHQRAAARLGPK
jgi:hypothetical protein